MWRIFKEAIWDYLLGRLLTVLGTVETVWAIVVLAKPEYGNALLPNIDNRVWYGIALAFMLAVSVRMLKVASDYKKRIESPDNIRFVYNEKRYKPCKQIRDRGSKEIYRVGIRVIGHEPIESLIVIPDQLIRIDDGSYQAIPTSQIKLHPMIDNIETIYRGLTPAYYVDVFSHVKGRSSINICYDQHIEGDISLKNGQYSLPLIARAKPKTSHMGFLLITMKDGNTSVEMRKRDNLGG